MTISICIPTYRRPDLLCEAVSSCLEQTLMPYEILIGDDSDDDHSEKVIYDLVETTTCRIRYFKNKTALGQADNVNNLIENVAGDKMVLLHDDDVLLKNALKEMADCFERFEVDAVYGKQYMINEEGTIDEEKTEILNNYFFRTPAYSTNQLSSLEAGIVQQFPNDGYMIRSEIAKKIKYRKKEVIGNAGDFDFGFRLGMLGCKFYFLNSFTAKYRLTSSSVAHNGTDSGLRSYKILSTALIPKNDSYLKSTLKRKAPIAILQALEFGNKKEAINIFFSKWHRGQIVSPGGLKRLLLILM